MVWSLLFSFLTGGIGKFADTYRDLETARIKESTEINQVVKEIELKRLETTEAAIEAAKEVRIAMKDHWEIRLAVALVAIPTSFHYACIVIDTVYKLGWDIPNLPPPLGEWQGAIILSYFGFVSARHGINAVAQVLLRRKR